MNERPTPETDAVIEVCSDGSNEFHGEWVNADFARRLECERDEARTTAGGFIVKEHQQRSKIAEKDAQIAEMREAVKDADAALRGCLKYMLGLPMPGSDLECEVVDDAHHALAKLKPFLTD